jgi:pentatricopeptide repeat protein
MHVKNIMPDSHTFVAALRACSKIGDINTAYDVLQELKNHHFPVTEHIYNELIRTYGKAC